MVLRRRWILLIGKQLLKRLLAIGMPRQHKRKPRELLAVGNSGNKVVMVRPGRNVPGECRELMRNRLLCGGRSLGACRWAYRQGKAGNDRESEIGISIP